ncbi:MAG: hypothetical protein M1480_06335 [Bacteroidetes bacterium]|nr:hypothetical protein [Bacteroidota bacterium]
MNYFINNPWISVTISAILIIVFLIWISFKIYTSNSFTVEERTSFWGPVFIILFLISGLIVSQGILWANNIKNLESEPFLYSIGKDAYGSDIARKIYETRSVLGLVESLAIAMITLVIPLLLVIWNYAKQTIINKIDNLIKIKNDVNENVNKDLLDGIILDSFNRKDIFLKNGKNLKPWFYGIVVASIIFLITLAYTNIANFSSDILLIVIVFEKVGAIILSIWLISFLMIYQLSINPLLGEFEHLNIFTIPGYNHKNNENSNG